MEFEYGLSVNSDGKASEKLFKIMNYSVTSYSKS